MKRKAPRVTAAPAASRDAGDIAILEDAGDIIARRNQFNLDYKMIQFFSGWLELSLPGLERRL